APEGLADPVADLGGARAKVVEALEADGADRLAAVVDGVVAGVVAVLVGDRDPGERVLERVRMGEAVGHVAPHRAIVGVANEGAFVTRAPRPQRKTRAQHHHGVGRSAFRVGRADEPGARWAPHSLGARVFAKGIVQGLPYLVLA